MAQCITNLHVSITLFIPSLFILSGLPPYLLSSPLTHSGCHITSASFGLWLYFFRGEYSLKCVEYTKRCAFIIVNNNTIFHHNFSYPLKGIAIFSKMNNSDCEFQGPFLFDTHASSHDGDRLAHFFVITEK